jgi:hypothetical protein
MPATTVHDFGAPPDWAALDRIVALLAETPEAFDPGWFMYMGRAVTKRGVTIHLYKHYLTRRHLNLDDACHAYRYRDRRLPDGGWSNGWYAPYPDLHVALSHARLWEVPLLERALDDCS